MFLILLIFITTGSTKGMEQTLSLRYQAARCVVKNNLDNKNLTQDCRDYLSILKLTSYFQQAKASIILSTDHFVGIIRDHHRSVKTETAQKAFNATLQKLTEYAVLFSNEEALQLLLNYNSDYANLIIDKQNRSLLMYAHTPKDIHIAKLLLEKGADCAACDDGKKTVLMHAAYINNIQLAELLLEKANDINTRDYVGRSAVDHALQANAQESVLYLLQRGSAFDGTENLLYWPITHNNIFLVHELMKRGATINALPWNLKQAIIVRNLNMLQFLCENNADVNLVDDDGNTALFYAAEQPDSVPILQILLDHHADINHQNNDGQTALHRAAKKGSFESAIFLCDHKADINLKDNTGNLPLDKAVLTASYVTETVLRNNLEKIINHLSSLHKKDRSISLLHILRCKALLHFSKLKFPRISQIFQTDSKGRMQFKYNDTDFIEAIHKDNPEPVHLYLNAGNSMDKTFDPFKHSTILHSAAECNSKKIVALTLKHNTNLNIKNRYGQTPLMVARLNHAYEAEELIKQAMRDSLLKKLNLS